MKELNIARVTSSVDFDTWGIDSESILGGIDKELAESILIDTGIDSFAYTWPSEAKIDSFTNFWFYFLFFYLCTTILYKFVSNIASNVSFFSFVLSTT
jgi:hypothetical protein